MQKGHPHRFRPLDFILRSEFRALAALGREEALNSELGTVGA
jgi:hypothetical protein